MIDIERVARPGEHVYYIICSEYSKECTPVSAQELQGMYEWCVLHLRQLAQDAAQEWKRPSA